MSIKIFFFGSSNFSIDTLITIHENKNFEIVGILTGMPKKIGRKQILTENIVKKTALSVGIKSEIIFEINNLKEDDLYNKISNISFDIGIVVSFGYLIPLRYIKLAKIDMINLHPSSLPKFRGASPVQKTIEAGLDFIDICIIKIDSKMDAGDLLMKERCDIKFNQHADDLIPILSKQGSFLVEKAINYLYINKNKLSALYTSQVGEISYASKIKNEDLLINFEEDGIQIYNKIRANNLDGGMYFIYNNNVIKIFKSEFIYDSQSTKDSKKEEKVYGLIKNEFNQEGLLHVKGGIIKPVLLQQSGKKILSYKEFFIGFRW